MIMVMMMKIIFGDDDDGNHFVGKKMVMMPIFFKENGVALGVQIITTAEAETLPNNWSGRREVDDDDDIFQLCDNWELKDDGC